MIYWLAAKLTNYTLRNDYDKKYDRDTVELGLKVILNLFFIFILTIIISLITGRFLETMIGTIALTGIRYYSGGHHLPSSDLCVIYTVAIFIGSPYIAEYIIVEYKIWIDLVSLSLVIMLSPFRDSFRLNNKDTIRKKLLSTIVIVINLIIIHSPVASAAMLIQALDLITFKKGGEEL